MRTFMLSVLALMMLTSCELCTANETKLDAAITALRQAAGAKPEDNEAQVRQFEEAWQTIRSAGEKGAARLEAELTSVVGHSREEEWFRIYAAHLLFEIRGVASSQHVAELLTSVQDRRLLTSTFLTAVKAAQTRDSRVLPILRLWVGAVDLDAFLPVHSLSIAWPKTVEALYCSCGFSCMADLKRMLYASSDPAELGSAAHVLSRTMEPEILPRIRELALSGTSEAKFWAVQALGWYGHPDDFEFLRSNLTSKDQELVFRSIFALIDFGDLRASSEITPYLDSANDKIRNEALLACTYLPTVQSTDRLIKNVTEKGNQLDGDFDEQLLALCEELEMEKDTFLKNWLTEKEHLISEIIRLREKSYDLKEGESAMSREELLESIREWSIKGEISDRVSTRHILATATAEDIPLFVELKSRLLHRFSDECLDDVQKVDQIVRRLGRTRYRKEVGTTVQVEGIDGQ